MLQSCCQKLSANPLIHFSESVLQMKCRLLAQSKNLWPIYTSANSVLASSAARSCRTHSRAPSPFFSWQSRLTTSIPVPAGSHIILFWSRSVPPQGTQADIRPIYTRSWNPKEDTEDVILGSAFTEAEPVGLFWISEIKCRRFQKVPEWIIPEKHPEHITASTC